MKCGTCFLAHRTHHVRRTLATLHTAGHTMITAYDHHHCLWPLDANAHELTALAENVASAVAAT